MSSETPAVGTARELQELPDVRDVFERAQHGCALPGIGAADLCFPVDAASMPPTSAGDLHIFIHMPVTMFRVEYGQVHAIARYDADAQMYSVDAEETWMQRDWQDPRGSDAARNRIAKMVADALNTDAPGYARLSDRLSAARLYLDVRADEVDAKQHAQKLSEALDRALAKVQEAARREREARVGYLAALED